MDDAAIIKKLLEGSDASAPAPLKKTPPKHSNAGAVPLQRPGLHPRAPMPRLGGGRRSRRAIAEEKALSGSAVSTFEYGINPLYEFELEVDATSKWQPSRAWPGDPRRRR